MSDVADSILDMLQKATDEMDRLRAENERLTKKCEVLEAAWRRGRSGPIQIIGSAALKENSNE